MASYVKSLKAIEVHTRIGDTFTATDVNGNPIASRALDEFRHGKEMHIFADPKDFIPFHAVDYLVLTNTVGEIERADAYCKSGTAIVGRGKVCESGAGC